MGGLTEESVDKRRLPVRVPIMLCLQVASKFGRAGDKGTKEAFVRALKAARGDAPLTAEEKKLAAAIRKANMKHRMDRRAERDAAKEKANAAKKTKAAAKKGGK